MIGNAKTLSDILELDKDEKKAAEVYIRKYGTYECELNF